MRDEDIDYELARRTRKPRIQIFPSSIISVYVRHEIEEELTGESFFHNTCIYPFCYGRRPLLRDVAFAAGRIATCYTPNHMKQTDVTLDRGEHDKHDLGMLSLGLTISIQA